MPAMQAVTSGNGSARVKTPLMSKFFQTPQRKPSIKSDGGSEDSAESAAPPPITVGPTSMRRPSANSTSLFHRKGDSRSGKLKTMMAFANTSSPASTTTTSISAGGDPHPGTQIDAYIPTTPSQQSAPSEAYGSPTSIDTDRLVREGGGSMDSTGWDDEYDDTSPKEPEQTLIQSPIQAPGLSPTGPAIVHKTSVVRKPVQSHRPRDEEPKPPTPTTPKAPEPAAPARKPSEGGYKLQPVTYSPGHVTGENTPTQQPWDDQSEASWTPGDDDPSRGLPQNPVTGAPRSHSEAAPDTESKSGGEEDKEDGDGEDGPPQLPHMPRIPPRLPLLYFEQDQQVDQMDFAYQKPRHTPTPSGSTSQTDLVSGRDTNANLIANGTPDKKSTTKPSPPQIDTQISRKPVSAGKSIEAVKSSRKEQGSAGDADESNNSFYWHSPHSSTDDSAKSPKPFEEIRPSDLDKRAKEEMLAKGDAPSETRGTTATGISGSPGSEQEANLTSATALGFGGPSDWEHFAEYDAEEVDDIDLYISHKKEAAELPDALGSPKEPPVSEPNLTMSMIGSNQLRGLVSGEREMLPTIQERASEALEEDQYIDRKIMNQAGGEINVAAVVDAHPPPPPPTQGSQEDLNSGSENQFASIPENREPQIPINNDTAKGPCGLDVSKDLQQPSEDAKQGRKQPPPAIATVANDVEGENAATPMLPSSLASVDAQIPGTAREVNPSNDQPQNFVAGNANDIVEQVVESQDTILVSKDNTRTPDTLSQLTSPASDDGKEDIIISLQVPGTPPPGAIPAPLNIQDIRSRNGVASQPREQAMRSPDLLRSGRRSIYPGSVELEDPYHGLEAWAKASLNRYVKMLREEAQAGTDEEKYTTFINFMQREMHVRAVFYDMEDDSDASDHPIRRVPSKRRDKEKLGPRNNIRSKALPALPPAVDNFSIPRIEEPGLDTTDVVKTATEETESFPPRRNDDDESGLTIEQVAASVAGPSAPTQGNSDESFVIVDTPKEDKLARTDQMKETKEKSSSALKGAPSLNALRKALDIVATRKTPAPKVNQTVDMSVQINQGISSVEEGPSGSPHATDGNATEQSPDPEAERGGSSPSSDRPSYKSFSNHEGKPYEGDKAANRQSIYRPFSTMLRATSIRSAPSEADLEREKSPGPSLKETPGSGEGDKTFGMLSPNNLESAKPVNYRYTVLEPLLSVVPQESVLRHQPEQLVRLRQGMDAIPDDFSFIHKTVLAWDAEAKKTRERCERERHARQGQNEQRIDELFNANEIGYSDIARLEADFKRSEAAKKAEEDREEVQTFVSSVFDAVWARINYEMDQLSPLYDECTKLVSEASAGRGMFEETAERVPIAPSMEVLLILYQKLMIRHQKAFEAVLERDRRLKKTEVAPWYTIGAIDKVKRIEKRFEDAEKKAILEFCRQRDERANLLMDVLDQNTLRGVGANQDYMESVMQAVRRIAQDVAVGKGFGGGRSDKDKEDVISSDEVLKAKTITTALARSSEQIVQTFHIADMLLNAADYEVSVANAKLSAADAAAFRRLRDAKAKEDAKLALDLEHRMSLIRGDTSRTQDEIAKLLMLIERRPGNFGGSGGPGNALMKAQALQLVQQGQLEVLKSQQKLPTPPLGSQGSLKQEGVRQSQHQKQLSQVGSDGDLEEDEEVFGGALEEAKRGNLGAIDGGVVGA